MYLLCGSLEEKYFKLLSVPKSHALSYDFMNLLHDSDNATQLSTISIKYVN